MYKLLLSFILLVALVACGASNDRPAQTTVDDSSGGAHTTGSIDSTRTQPTRTYKVTFLELGAESCIPCKMMKPIMRDIAAEYPGIVEVIFHDLYRDREIGQRWNVRVMPTQVFLDSEGREFFRHEGFYPKEQLKEMLDNYLATLSRE